MEQFVLVPISIYNSKIKPSSTVTKSELPTYQVEKTPEYQVDSLKKDIEKNFLLRLTRW